jgi:SOS response regulatory protein OraA/RecX
MVDRPSKPQTDQARPSASRGNRPRSSRLSVKDASDPEAATLAALRSLARADQSRAQLARKLTLKGFSTEAIDGAFLGLERAGWLNDHRALNALADRQRARALGPLKMLAEMRQKGFKGEDAKQRVLAEAASSDVVQSHTAHSSMELADARSHWVHQALTALIRKFKERPLSDPKEVTKALRFLAARGFNLSQSRDAIKHYQSTVVTEQSKADDRDETVAELDSHVTDEDALESALDAISHE